MAGWPVGELGVLRTLRDNEPHPHIANLLAELGDTEAAHVHAVLQYSDGGSLKRYLQDACKKTPTGGAGLQGMAPSLVHRARSPDL